MTERAGRVQFDRIDTHEDLIAWSRRYCERAVAVHDLAVDLEGIEWTVSTRARRRAAAVKTPRIADATVGEAREWPDGIPTCECSLSWAAFEAFDRGEWRETLRHELLHVEQFQRYGATDHGPEFRDRAEDLDASVTCRRFADANYHLLCTECDSVVARRYRASKLVTEPDRYRSECCGAPLESVEQ